jgi:hypothetical protein
MVMLSAVLLCNFWLYVAPLPEPSAAGPTVTALEIVEVRRGWLKPTAEPARPRFSPERPGMKLVVEIQGEDVVHASHFGKLELGSATDDKGEQLQLNEDALGFHDPRTEFVPIDRGQMFFGEDNPPKDLIRIELPFESPARAASAISVRGKLQLKRVETVDVVVPTTPGEVQNDRLDKLGVKVKIVKPEEDDSFSYEVAGKLDAVNQAQLVTAQGKPLETNGSSSMSDGETLRRDISLAQPLPADAQLKLSLVVKAENVPVPFELKELKLP